MTEAHESTPAAGGIVDAAARARAVAAGGSVLVQAPAGSGKTTLLAQRYLRLLAQVEAPEQILALTFTRRAALEMRERVMGALDVAALGARPAHFNEQTWECALAARHHLAGRGIDIENHPSRLRIETIDAFNAWLAGQLPITAGTGARLKLIDNPQPLYEEAARRALAHEEADSFGSAVERVLALDDQRWRRLVELIAGMLPTRDRWLPLLAGRLQAASSLDEPQLRMLRRHFDEDLELLVTRALRTAHEVLGARRLAALAPLLHAAALALDGRRTDMVAWQHDATPLTPAGADLARWRGLADICLTGASSLRRRLTIGEGFVKGADKERMLEWLAEFEHEPKVLAVLTEIRTLPEPRYGDDEWARVREVAQVLVLAAAELQQVFRDEGAADFPAVSLAALRALGTDSAPSDLALRLDYRLQHILIDEFQDTSSAQLELVRLLTAGWQVGDGRSVFCVGDPMQSIYGFRQAEVRAFLELAEEGIGDLRFDLQRLSSNFRSARVLVEWINERFARILPRNDDRDRGAIAFRPSHGALGAANGMEPGVSVRGFASREHEARAIAELIETRRREHPDWRIAILVRAKAHARDIATSLHQRGVAFQAPDIEPLQDRALVRDLVMLTCALLHLGDRTAWLALLRAPWIGLSLADLLTLARAAPVVILDALRDEAVLDRLSAAGRARCVRVRSVLDAAFGVQGQGPLSRWVQRVWLALGGPACARSVQELDHVRPVFARLRELERRALPDAAELVESFADLYAEGAGAGAVEIMTIHKAKGLEFDMVVLPALERATRSHRDELLLTHQFARTGRDGMVMAARPALGAETGRLFEFLRRQARDAAALEAERLLYVACTRAKWQLHLTATLEPPAEVAPADAPPTRRPPRAGSLLAVMWPVVAHEFIEAVTHAAPAAPAAPDTDRPAVPLNRVPGGWSPNLDWAAPSSAATLLAVARREETPVFDWAGETARRVGNLVHAELQVLDLESSDEPAIRAREAHFTRWLAQNGVPADRLEDASARVIAALLGVRADARGRWILKKGYRDDFREHALSANSGGEVVRVVFDRSFIDEEGVRWVIDYKTSHHAGGGVEEFLRREVERYRPQLQRYALLARKLGPEPVRVGLYFPLMKAWREWQPES
jgi:ATP-dependent exoDNAse (exonuclease V) beta subunit